MKTKQIIEQMEKEFDQYSSDGYNGGKDGLRCSECDRKYSGEAKFYQLCAVCNFRSSLRTLLESFGEEVIGHDKSIPKHMKDYVFHSIAYEIKAENGLKAKQRLKVKEILEVIK